MHERKTKPVKKLDYPKLRRKFYYPRNNYRTAVKIIKYLEIHRFPTTKMISDATVNNHHDTKITMEFLKKLGYVEEYRIVVNSDHKCMHCKKSSQFVVSADSIQSSLEILENNHQAMIRNKSKPDFKRKDYFPYEKDHVLGRLAWMECKQCQKHDESANEILFKISQNRLWTLTNRGKYIFLVLFKDEKLTKIIRDNLDVKIFELIYALKQSAEKLSVKNLISKLNRTKHDDDESIFEIILSEWYESNFEKVMNTKYSDSLHQPLIDYQEKYKWEHMGKHIQNTRKG
ncbi:hypothetical protein [Nitrosopumilus sp.]|uniref:hypothetical protein n=1 Tax=Nitrosopumilus sp. TaxID=2024843 RepID=UPI0034A0076C